MSGAIPGRAPAAMTAAGLVEAASRERAGWRDAEGGRGAERGQGGPGRWQRMRAWLWPVDGGRGSIPALDGLRALAALSVLVYHATSMSGAQTVIAGRRMTWMYFYAESGVDLFFVLSGFLLFLPYARAILDRTPGPGALRFYRRRALRILPAYYVCLGVVALYETLRGAGPSLGDIAAHLFLVHDIIPPYNRTIAGPFWTLAIEWQFYLVLPLIAWLIGRVSASRPGRLALATAGVIAVALGVRFGAAQVVMRERALPRGWVVPMDWALRLLVGSQGKYLEVFGVGMLCAVAYVVAVERGGLSARRAWSLGLGLLVFSAAIYLAFGPEVFLRRNAVLAEWYGRLDPTDLDMMLGPLALGTGYGALLLGTLLGPATVRAVFSWKPLRFVGLVSYSLYLWHETALNTVYPLLRPPSPPTALNGVEALAVGLFVAIPFAWVMYQLVERPFLKLR